MPRRPSNRDLVELTVLAFLLQGPRHPYELHRLVVDTHKDYIGGLPRSLYHAVDQLADDELIVPVETSRQGRRPERTVYEITPEGRAELAARMRRLLERPDTDSLILVAGVSLLGCLPPQEAIRCLRARQIALEQIINGLAANAAAQHEAGLPRLLLLEVECERALLGAELEWVNGVLADLRAGVLTWSSPLTEADLGTARAAYQNLEPKDDR